MSNPYWICPICGAREIDPNGMTGEYCEQCEAKEFPDEYYGEE